MMFNRFKNPIMVNSIPKSGTNLLKNIILSIPGARLFGDVSLAAEIHSDEERLRYIENRIRTSDPGDVYTGHIPFSPEIAKWLQSKNFKHVFIYRDPRDVTVSLYHYIMRDSTPKHAYYDLYNSLGNDSERLLAAICGLGEGRTKYRLSKNSIPNIRSVYESYLGWIKDDNVFSTRYENLIGKSNQGQTNPMRVVTDLLRYLGASNAKDNAILTESVWMEGSDRKKSHTFRKGVNGTWREEYTRIHMDSFRNVMGDLLEQLGYEWD